MSEAGGSSSGDDQSKDQKPTAPDDRFAEQRKSITTFRNAIQWAIAAVGAIGALLVSSIPLADLGAVQGWDALFAGIGIFAVIGGILAIIMTAIAGLRPRAVRFSDLPSASYQPKESRLRRFFSVEVRAKLATQNRIQTNKLDLLSVAYHDNEDPVDALLEDRTETQRALELAAQERAPLKEFRRTESLLRSIEHQLSRIAWIQRYEMQRALYRAAAWVTFASVIIIGLGMTLLLIALHDDDAARKNDAETAKIEAETRKLDAETAKIVAETALLDDQDDDDDDPPPPSDAELDWSVTAGGDVIVAEGDVSVNGGGVSCATTSPQGVAQLERRVAAVTLVILAEDNTALGSDDSSRAALEAFLQTEYDDLDDLQRWLQERYADPAGGDGVAICGDWQAVVDELVQQWATDVSIDNAVELRQEVVNQLAGRFRAVVGDTQAGALATATVIVENEISNAATPGMD
ncbi:MAG: hypothetical protein AAGA37_22340 [Actinomycetota bacterium]